MASFARSFKPPAALLSPRRRPGMTGRTLSNSSELSLGPSAVSAHQTDYFVDHAVTSAPNSLLSLSPACGPVSALEEGPQSIAGSPDLSSNSSRAHRSNPIAIEIPKPRRNFSSGPTCTPPPPEPLSARGDLPGAYFPLHEDPRERVRRPHPFASESAHLHQNWLSDSMTMQTERARSSHGFMSSSVTHSSTPVSSYIAPGFHDAPLPLGKYYPTNYEQQHPRHDVSKSLHSTFAAPSSASSSVKSDLAPQARAELRRSESPQMEMRRRMQQYQRDMVAQATMVLGATTRTASPGVSLNGLPIKDIWLSGSMPNKPLSPRLHPLGSPGPVTPMELESSGRTCFDVAAKSPSKSGLAPPRA
ncbi:hypothetical protein E4U43_001611 [Claviceps pusilla]|uniref:Uncharacterized protein n=1 Tax=Claviceps pusilla TaxID=123648 RepID=A0A9P7NA12_9HYPO|nr:hypothetical protein E4U43_001611 [Claviceps pusilla]